MHKKHKKILIIIFILSLTTLLVSFAIFIYVKKGTLFVAEDNLSYLIKNSSSILFDDELFQNYYDDRQFNQDILNYSIEIELKPETKIISGKTRIIGTFLNSTDDIYLNFYDNMKIEKLLLNGKDAVYETNATGILVRNDIDIDTFDVVMEYNGSPKQLGLGSFNFGEYNGSPVIYNLSEPVFASTWFPCNDLPTDKALSEIKITADSNLYSVSNGILVDVKQDGNKKTYHWKSEYPVSTYLIAFCTADYSSFNDQYISTTKDTISMNYYVFKGKEEKATKDFSIHQNAMKFFESTFGEYPFKKEKYGVAEFLWDYGAMENQTITGISTNMVTGHRMYTDILVHELAHQWWGNAVGLSNWKEIWLNEGFATYSEALFFEAMSGSSALQSTMDSKKRVYDNTSLYNPKLYMFSNTIYDKGAWVLHMLRREMGDKTFFELLRNYYQKFKYKNASTEDLKMLAEQLSGKDLTKFFDQWIYEGVGTIELNYQWDQNYSSERSDVRLELTQSQDDYKNYTFPLDITLLNANHVVLDTSIYVNSEKQKFKFFVRDSVSIIKFDKNNWILAQISEAN